MEFISSKSVTIQLNSLKTKKSFIYKKKLYNFALLINYNIMKKNLLTIIFAIILAVITVVSCKKEKSDPIDTSKITFGNTERMYVTEYDSTILNYFHQRNIDIDINGDGNNDIKLNMHIDEGNVYAIRELIIKCLHNNIELLCESIVEERYVNYDTIIWSDDYVHVTYTKTITNCGKIAENDTLYSTNTWFKLTDCNENSQLSIDNHFKVYDNTLYRTDNWISAGPAPYHDTLYEHKTHCIEHCTNFPENEVTYIGFKFTENHVSRLGWIKIELIPAQYIVNLKLLETAIQK